MEFIYLIVIKFGNNSNSETQYYSLHYTFSEEEAINILELLKTNFDKNEFEDFLIWDDISVEGLWYDIYYYGVNFNDYKNFIKKSKDEIEDNILSDESYKILNFIKSKYEDEDENEYADNIEDESLKILNFNEYKNFIKSEDEDEDEDEDDEPIEHKLHIYLEFLRNNKNN